MSWTKRVAAAAGIVMLAAAPAQAQPADTVIIGAVGQSSVTNWPSYVAASKGYFEAAGIKPDLVFPPSSSGLVQQLAARSIDVVLSAGLVDPLRAIDKGAPIAIVRIAMQSPPYALLAKPGIKSMAELKGKTISVGGAKDITRLFLDRMVAAHGLKPGSYDMLYAGATGARFAALKSGAVDAAMLLPPFTFYAESEGFRNLGLTVDYARDLPFSGSMVNRDWANKNPALLKRLLAANQKGIDELLDPRNRDEAITIFQKFSKLKREDVAKAYDFLIQHNFFDASGRISRSRFANLAGALKELGDIEGSTDISRFVLPGVVEIVN
ncbi:MAG: ABC transporter substrate-binding protein [Hyphomicrobiales bacterium]|nr:ABC transporter substrate-binding protein [Hyphomicrobiales bacterium]